MRAIFKDDTLLNFPDLLKKSDLYPHKAYREYDRTIYEKDYGLYYLKYELADIQLDYFDVRYHTPGSYLKECRDDTLDMIFFMEGTLHIIHRNGEKEMILPNRHNLCYTAPGSQLTQWQLESKKFKVLVISLPKNMLNNYPISDSMALTNFMHRMETGKSARLDMDCMPISSAMNDILEVIINCSKKEIGKWLFLESKIQELLSLQLEQSQNPKPTLGYRTNPENIEKIKDAMEFVTANLDIRISLEDLAKKVGTNTFTLKQGFKEVYGISVFAYWNNSRMKKAKSLLRESVLSIGEISDTLGFKNQHYFSTAFKKEFGTTPSQFRNSSN